MLVLGAVVLFGLASALVAAFAHGATHDGWRLDEVSASARVPVGRSAASPALPR